MSGHSIFLVRHGEAAASWGESADPGLSPLGKQQAKDSCRRLAEDCAGERPRILSSPLARARETAEPLAELYEVAPKIDARFSEIPSPVPLAERQDWLRAFMRGRWTAQDSSLHAWRDTMLAAVLELDSDTVIFTHFLVINTLVGWLQQRDETLTFWPDNASVTRLSLVDGKLGVAQLGGQMPTRVN